MRLRPLAVALICTLLVWGVGSRPEARVEDDATVHATALKEMLEGSNGRRETWTTTPTLVILASVMDYKTGDLATGFHPTSRTLSSQDLDQLTVDLTAALEELTDGRLGGFREVIVEVAEPGRPVSMFRPGQIVVGRFHGVMASTGNLGYGGRSTRRSGTISGAVVVLDEESDRDPRRRQLVRTHELGHALGYNHVVSRPSIMNPRVGSALSDFDRAAIRQAVPQSFGLN